MKRAEAIQKYRAVCLNPRASRAAKNRALNKLVDYGVPWDCVRRLLIDGTRDARIRFLDIIADKESSDARVRWAANKLYQGGMSFASIRVWILIHRAPELFHEVFERAAKALPHILKVEKGT